MNFTNIPRHTSLPFLNREEAQKLAKPPSICATKQNTKPDQFRNLLKQQIQPRTEQKPTQRTKKDPILIAETDQI